MEQESIQMTLSPDKYHIASSMPPTKDMCDGIPSSYSMSVKIRPAGNGFTIREESHFDILSDREHCTVTAYYGYTGIQRC